MFDKNRTPRVFVGFGFLLTEKAALKSAKAGVTDKGAPEIPRGIQDICKSDSGQAIIVLQSMEHDGEHNYWRTSAWKAKNSNWCEVHNIYGARLPSYVWFTSKPNHKPSPGKDYLGKDAASAIYEIHKTGELQKNEEFRIK